MPDTESQKVLSMLGLPKDPNLTTPSLKPELPVLPKVIYFPISGATAPVKQS